MEKFYNREEEIEYLEKIEDRSKQMAQMTVMVGRRRIGKTTLLKKAFAEKRSLYLFVERKNEALLCEEFVSEIENQLQINVFGQLNTFKDVFGFLMNLSQHENFTLIIDEFQEFKNINPGIFSEMQNLWDSMKENSKINLILCGSIYSMMTNIFENNKEPLFGRATAKINLKAFDVKTIKTILYDNNKDCSNDDLLAFYIFTGGVAKYIEMLINSRAFTLDDIVDEVFSKYSLFLEEGKNVLIDEFGKDYGNYFSILSLIASSKTSRSEIESILNSSVGGYLDKLEYDFNLISKVRPILSKPGSRNLKYRIDDNFLNFWFRFVYKNSSAVKSEQFNYLKDIFRRDYNVFSGIMLERYFIDKLAKEMNISEIGSYWEAGNQNEIDIIALNKYDKTALIAEVKRNKSKIDIEKLKVKSSKLITNLKDYSIEYKALSMDDM